MAVIRIQPDPRLVAWHGQFSHKADSKTLAMADAIAEFKTTGSTQAIDKLWNQFTEEKK
jgi:hypothetical protein